MYFNFPTNFTWNCFQWGIIRLDVTINVVAQLTRRVRRGSAAAHLLGLRVPIPLGHGCLSTVSAVCCQLEFSVSSWSLVQRVLPIVVCLNVILKPRKWGGPGSLVAVAPQKNIINIFRYFLKGRLFYSMQPDRRTDGRTDRQTYRLDEAKIAFPNFANAPKIFTNFHIAKIVKTAF